MTALIAPTTGAARGVARIAPTTGAARGAEGAP